MRSDAPALTERAWLHSGELEQDVALAARSDVPVLISGEPGVGKLFVARLIHERSDHRRASWVRIGCAETSVRQLEVEMLGQRRSLRAGRDEPVLLMPHSATVVLEEIDHLSASLQSALERILESGATGRLGGDSVLWNSDVRIVSTMTADARNMSRPERISERLFYRLNTTHLVIPPLRERREDIPRLVHHWIADGERHGLKTPRLSTETFHKTYAQK